MSITIPLDAITDITEYLSEEVRVRSNYSGRGMYGKPCLGVVVDSDSALIEFVATAVRDVARADFAGSDHPLTEFVNDHLTRISSDSHGQGAVYYWPSVQVEGTGTDEEED